MKKVAPRPEAGIPTRSESLRSVFLFLGGYALFFWGLACWKAAMLNSGTGETAIIVHGLWSTLHWKFFWHNAYGMSYFGDHGGFILLLLVPFYALFPSPSTVLLLQSVSIAACGVPVFLIARRVLDDRFAAWCLMLAFLFFPTIVSQHVNQTHETQFILPFLLFTYYLYETQQFGWFLAFTVVSCLGKENVPLTIMMFAGLAALQRRGWKWIVPPLAISVATLGLTFKVIMPYFRGNRPYRTFGYFGSLGHTPMQVIGTVLTTPSVWFNQTNIFFLLELIQPLVWVLPFLSLPVILALPDLLVNLVVQNDALKVIRWHYNMTVGAFLVVATVYSVKKANNWLTRRYGAARYPAGLGVLLVCMCVSQWFLWINPNEYRPSPYRDALIQALNLVPKDASVLVPSSLLATAASRRHALNPQYLLYIEPHPQMIFDYKYLVLDMNERDQPIPPKLVEILASNPSYQLLFNKENVLVFRRNGEEVDDEVLR
ncbi:MAG TPA: DUF2079 domain-containing protein [Verrucomicrobiae bacterium]|nr:DUF2079 domain-containing protein [Verrucomicrobiae bacterium]